MERRPRGGVVKGCIGSRGEESWLERLMRFNNGVFESQLKEFPICSNADRADLKELPEQGG